MNRRPTTAMALTALLWLVVASVSPSVRADSLTVEQVLARWADAMGGRNTLAEVKSTYQFSDLATSGMNGTYEEWVTTDGKWRYSLTLAGGAMTVQGGCIGDSCWRRDMNGQTTWLDGVDLQDALTGVYLATNSQFFPGQGTAEMALVTASNDNELGLRITPKNGKSATYFLDKQTYLPVRMEIPETDRTRTSWYSDWRAVDGMQVPYHMQQGSGDSTYDMFLTIQSFATNEDFPDSVFAPPTERAKDYNFTTGDRTEPIPVTIRDNHVYVPVKVNGSRTLWFIFDSGAEMTVINKRITDELGLVTTGALEGRGVGAQSIQVGLVQGMTYEVPGVIVSNQRAAVIPLERIETVSGVSIDGILGYDFMSRFVTRIDYAGGLIQFFEPSTYTYEGPAKPIPFELEGSLPSVTIVCSLPGCPRIVGKYMLDTGMSQALALNSPTVSEYGLLKCAEKTLQSSGGMGIGGRSKAHLTRATTITIGEAEVKNLVIALATDTVGATATRDQVGSFGGEILQRFTFTLDYHRKQIYLQPNSKLTSPHDVDMSGLLLQLAEDGSGRVMVESVLPESPAAEAGVQIGDEIIAVDGQPVAGMKLWDVRELLRKVDLVVPVTYRRGDTEATATLHLRRMI